MNMSAVARKPQAPVKRASVIMRGAELQRFKNVTWTAEDQAVAERSIRKAREEHRARKRRL